MSHFIDIAAVEDNRMLVDSLWAWASESRGIRLTAVTSTVDELLRARREPVDLRVTRDGTDYTDDVDNRRDQLEITYDG